MWPDKLANTPFRTSNAPCGRDWEAGPIIDWNLNSIVKQILNWHTNNFTWEGKHKSSKIWQKSRVRSGQPWHELDEETCIEPTNYLQEVWRQHAQELRVGTLLLATLEYLAVQLLQHFFRAIKSHQAKKKWQKAFNWKLPILSSSLFACFKEHTALSNLRRWHSGCPT